MKNEDSGNAFFFPTPFSHHIDSISIQHHTDVFLYLPIIGWQFTAKVWEGKLFVPLPTDIVMCAKCLNKGDECDNTDRAIVIFIIITITAETKIHFFFIFIFLEPRLQRPACVRVSLRSFPFHRPFLDVEIIYNKSYPLKAALACISPFSSSLISYSKINCMKSWNKHNFVGCAMDRRYLCAWCCGRKKSNKLLKEWMSAHCLPLYCAVCAMAKAVWSVACRTRSQVADRSRGRFATHSAKTTPLGQQIKLYFNLDTKTDEHQIATSALQ